MNTTMIVNFQDGSGTVNEVDILKQNVFELEKQLNACNKKIGELRQNNYMLSELVGVTLSALEEKIKLIHSKIC